MNCLMDILINILVFFTIFILGRFKRTKNEVDIFHIKAIVYIYVYVVYPIFFYNEYKEILIQHINICFAIYIVYGILCMIDTIVIKRKLARE